MVLWREVAFARGGDFHRARLLRPAEGPTKRTARHHNPSGVDQWIVDSIAFDHLTVVILQPIWAVRPGCVDCAGVRGPRRSERSHLSTLPWFESASSVRFGGRGVAGDRIGLGRFSRVVLASRPWGGGYRRRRAAGRWSPCEGWVFRGIVLFCGRCRAGTDRCVLRCEPWRRVTRPLYVGRPLRLRRADLTSSKSRG